VTLSDQVTAAGMVLGTAGYMAPEQVRGQEVDHRADLFALGAVLYEMLAGQRAFHGESAIETLNAILKEEPPELHAPPGLDRVVRRCLEKTPARRFHSLKNAVVLSVSSGGELAILTGRHTVAPFIGVGTLARVPLAGGTPREVLEDVEDADWTPDGKDLVIVAGASPLTNATPRATRPVFASSNRGSRACWRPCRAAPSGAWHGPPRVMRFGSAPRRPACMRS